MRRAAAALLLMLAAPAAARDIAVSWQGSYVCGQGTTALTLTIATNDKSRIAALFHFGPTPENQSVPTGCFEMAGRFDPVTGRLQLEPAFWITQPTGYVMVGLAGEIQGDALSGRVDGLGCTAFRLVRRQVPDAVAACRSLRSEAGPR